MFSVLYLHLDFVSVGVCFAFKGQTILSSSQIDLWSVESKQIRWIRRVWSRRSIRILLDVNIVRVLTGPKHEWGHLKHAFSSIFIVTPHEIRGNYMELIWINMESWGLWGKPWPLSSRKPEFRYLKAHVLCLPISGEGGLHVAIEEEHRLADFCTFTLNMEVTRPRLDCLWSGSWRSTPAFRNSSPV